MYERSDDHSWSFAAGLFVGALIGAAAASLYAPRSGPQNRELVREKGLVLKERVSDVATTATTKVSETTASVTERASAVATTVADRASSTVHSVQEAASTAATRVSETASVASEKVSGVASATVAKVSDVKSTATTKVQELTGQATGDSTSAEVASVEADAGTQNTATAPSETFTGLEVTGAEPAAITPEPGQTSLRTSSATDATMLVTDSAIGAESGAGTFQNDEQSEVDPTATRGARAYDGSNGSSESTRSGQS
jgi:gas vesicle protein